MIESHRKLGIASVLVAAVPLGGCGIDQGGVQSPPLPTGSTTAPTTVVLGPITGFGSVLVNGMTLDATTAQILIDGRFATESELAIGQIIRAVAIEGDSRLRAVSIEHEENVVGSIDALDAPAGRLSALGQRVIVDAETRFALPLAGIDALVVGEPIVVSGLTLPSGEIQATHIRRADAGATLQVTASITDLDVPGLTFALGNLTIDYSQAVLLQLPTGIPELDRVVEVRGNEIVNGVLVATEVRARPSLPGLFTAAATSLTDFESPLVGAAAGSNRVDVNFVGYITANDLPGSIALVDIDVALDVGTTVAGGTIEDLQPGAKVQIEGRVSSFGQIQAGRITVL